MKARLPISNQQPASSRVGRVYVLSRQFTNRVSACSSVVLYLFLSLIGNAQTPGTVDLSFDVGAGVNGAIGELILLGDGRAYVGGYPTRLARIENTGALDSSFFASANASVFALQPDGKIVWASGNGFGRMKPTGSGDPTFPRGEISLSGAASLAAQVDGRVVVGGFFTTVNNAPRKSIARLNPDGTVETNFTAGGGVNYRVNCLALQDDGKIIVGGEFASVGGLFRNSIARLNKDGSPDASFDPGWGADDAVRSVAIQPDRRIVIAGSFSLVDLTPRSRIARLNADGSLDASFQPGTGANDGVFTVVVQIDGKILIGGNFTNVNGVACKRVSRLNTDGTVDKSFDTSDGPDGPVNALAVRPEGKVLIGGLFNSVTGVARTNIAQLNGNIEPLVGPTILQPPLDQQVQTGQTVSMSVVASGTPPPAYQWLKDGAAIMGATSATFSITNVQLSDAGAYSVLVTNVAGRATAGPAAVVVDGRQPILTAQLSSPSGPLQIDLAASTQSIVVFEASSDLKAWNPVSTNRVPVDGVLRFTEDMNSTSQQQRFFRALTR